MVVRKGLMLSACMAGIFIARIETYAGNCMEKDWNAVIESFCDGDGSVVIDEKEPLEEAVVTGTRNAVDIRHLPFTVSVIGRRQIEQSYESSLLPVLSEQVSGLFVTRRSMMGYGVSEGAAGGISMRGLSGGSGRMMVLIDGHPQYMGLMGHPISDAYQSFLAERVEVLRGPASMLYGSNAMGGVINIVTRKMDSDGVRTNAHVGYGSYNTLETEVTNMVHKKGFSSVVSASYNRSDGHRDDTGFEQYGGYARLGYEFSDSWDVSADVNVTHFNASNPGTAASPVIDAGQRITRGMTSARLSNSYEKTSGALSFFYNWGNHYINDGYEPSKGETPLDYRYRSLDDMMGISLYQSVQMFKGNRLTAGVDWYRIGGRAWNDMVDTASGEPNGEIESIADVVQHEIAAYLDFRQNFGRWLTLDAGVRMDHHSRVGTEWVPQAGLSFHLPHSIELKLSAAKGFRYPTVREMYMFPPQNDGLQPERMWNYELAFSQTLLNGALRYGVNVFYIDADNIIMTTRVDGRPRNVNSGKLDNAGVELEAAYRISGNWSVDANYSYLNMKYPVAGAPEHKAYASASFTEGRWRISTGLQYINGLYTAVSPDPVRKENFLLWNLRASVRLTDWLSFFVKGDNLLARQYEINAGFPMPGATFVGGFDISF